MEYQEVDAVLAPRPVGGFLAHRPGLQIWRSSGLNLYRPLKDAPGHAGRRLPDRRREGVVASNATRETFHPSTLDPRPPSNGFTGHCGRPAERRAWLVSWRMMAESERDDLGDNRWLQAALRPRSCRRFGRPACPGLLAGARPAWWGTVRARAVRHYSSAARRCCRIVHRSRLASVALRCARPSGLTCDPVLAAR